MCDNTNRYPKKLLTQEVCRCLDHGTKANLQMISHGLLQRIEKAGEKINSKSNKRLNRDLV